MNAANIQPYSRAVVKLLKGIVEKDDVVWNDLLDYQSEIQDYIRINSNYGIGTGTLRKKLKSCT